MYMTWFICSIFAAAKSNLCIILKIKIMEENKKQKLDENQIEEVCGGKKNYKQPIIVLLHK